MVYGIDMYQQYLLGTRFTVVTDHSALTKLKTMSNSNPRLMRWVLKLQGYDFDVVHRPGREHVDADFLSRQCPPAEGIKGVVHTLRSEIESMARDGHEPSVRCDRCSVHAMPVSVCEQSVKESKASGKAEASEYSDLDPCVVAKKMKAAQLADPELEVNMKK